jgi:hypothetical protein
MAISGQEPIRIGQPNQSANSDSLYQAFNAIQNNFTTVFNTASNISTVVAGNGIQVSNVGNGVSITNTGVTRLIAGDNVTITNLNGAPGANGALVISSTGTGGNGGGTVTSVGIVSNTLSIVDTPVIGSGNISVNLPTLANVSGSYRNPNITVDSTGRVVSIANGSVSGTVTSVAVQAGAGVTVSGSPITTSGTITVTNTGVTSIVAGPGIAINQSNGAVTITNTGGGGSGGGTVTRVGVISNTLSVTGSPIITSGNISVELPTNAVFNTVTANTANIISINSNFIRITRTNSFSGFELDTFSNDSGVSRIVSKKARGTSASPSTIVSGDFLSGMRGDGYTTFNTYQIGGGIEFRSTGLPVNSTNFIPSRAIISAYDSSNNRHELVLNDNGNISLTGGITSIVYSNVSGSSTRLQGRSRGTVSNISPIQVGDSIFRENYYGYTGNGSSTLKDVPGFSFSAATYGVAVGLPTGPGQFIPTDYYIRTTSNSNISLDAVFSHTGNFTIPGSFNGENAVLSNSITANSANLGNSVTANFLIGTLNTSSQPNITQIGTLTTLLVTGNASIGNVSATTFTGNLIGNVTGNISGNIEVPGVDSAIIFNDEGEANGSANFTFNKIFNVATLNGNLTTGNANLGNLATANFLSGTLITSAQPNITQVGTLISLSVTGNVNSGNVIGGNLVTANFLTGTLTTSSQPNITSVGTLTSLAVTGNVNAGNVNATTLAGTLSVPSQTNITSVGSLTNLTVTGNISVTGNVTANRMTANLFTGTLVTGAQPNITSVGTLTSLAVTGNITANGLQLTNEATSNTTATITATVPIVIDGVTYKIMLTQ